MCSLTRKPCLQCFSFHFAEFFHRKADRTFRVPSQFTSVFFPWQDTSQIQLAIFILSAWFISLLQIVNTSQAVLDLQLTEAGICWHPVTCWEGTSVEDCCSWIVIGLSLETFSWLTVWKGTHCGQCYLWAGVPGSYEKAGWSCQWAVFPPGLLQFQPAGSAVGFCPCFPWWWVVT